MIALIVLSSALFWMYCLWFAVNGVRVRKKENRPPGTYELPVIGAAISVISAVGIDGLHYEKLHRVAKKFGKKILGLRLGNLNAVLTEDFETVRKVLNSPDWGGRFPNLSNFQEDMLFSNLGLVWSHSEPHREIRKFVFRTFRAIGFGELRQSEVFLQDELQHFVALMDGRIRGSDGKGLYMQNTFKIPALNTLWQVMCGYRFSYDDETIQKLIPAVDDVAHINIGFDPEWTFPFLRHIPGCSLTRAKRPSFIICHDFFRGIMNERRKTKDYLRVQTDFMDYFLKKIEEEETQKDIFCDDQFVVTCSHLLYGGLDTTANSLEFALIYMILHPHVQRKAQNEIDNVVGFNRFPSISDRPNLRYCEATMLETLRWANIIPINGRTVTCNTTLGGYNIDKDTLCAMNTTVIHMSQELWGDPEVFRPERFLDENNNIINNEKLFVFGGGSRHCPGYTQAKITWLAFFTTALQRYTFEHSPFHIMPDTTPICGVANSAKPYFCLVKPRR